MTRESTKLIAQLRSALGDNRVATDRAERELASTDFYSAGATCTAVIRPADAESLARAAAIITAAGFALIPRGGSMSYTGGYTPDSERSVIVDLNAMQSIVSINEEDMTITVQAGATWEAIYDALSPRGLRLPFFGTFSGRRATVGGGLSNGALFFGTARYSGAADHVLGLEIVTADGRLITTGQAAFHNGKAFYRTHGPDLTGLFIHDCGALGIKTQATFRLIQMPRATECLSFALPDASSAARALAQVARAGVAEEAYVFDPATTTRSLGASSLSGNLRRLGNIVSSQGSTLDGLKAGAKVVRAGKKVVPAGAYSLHVVCAGRHEAGVIADADQCRQLAVAAGGDEIPNSIPVAVRAAPFDNLNGALGPAGERWAALNAKVPHSDAQRVREGFDAILAKYESELRSCRVHTSTLFIAIDTHAFSFEAVFHWPDAWLGPHRTVPDAKHLATLTEPDPNPQGAALVAQLRDECLGLFSELGAASNQIGRTYPWRANLADNTGELFDTLKSHLDPPGLMNPGVLVRQRPC
jgi:FAD/FMN-containing dehydrogenase